MTIRAWVALSALMAACLPAVAPCQELGFFERLYGDRRAVQVGDTLHLVIAETSSASMAAGQDHSQSTDSKVGPGIGKLAFLPMLGYSATSTSQSKGTSSRTGNVAARMTVQVMEICPAGNLVVEGERTVVVNNDHETIRIHGEVRRKDVGADNTIYSYDLANVKVDYAGNDPRKPAGKVGFITRLLNFLF